LIATGIMEFKVILPLLEWFGIDKKESLSKDYWGDNDALFMDNLDSADKYLKDIKSKESTTVQNKEDSLKDQLNDRLNRNTFRLEITGICYIGGLVYERNLYRNKFDINVRCGTMYFPHRRERWENILWNFGISAKTNKFYVNPFTIVSVTGQGLGTYNEGVAGMLSLGIDYKFNKRWDVQVYQSTVVNSDFSEDGIYFYWGGINLGYSF
jgi:hypothetical protein